MSRKRKPSVILGPDGKPYVAPEPKPEPTTSRDVTITFDTTAGLGDIQPYWLSRYIYGLDIQTDFNLAAKIAKPKPRTLADAITEDVAALTADFEGESRPEMPAPERDLTAYRDAFATAAANCLHDDAVEMLYGRQWVCDACGRTLNRDDMRRASEKRSSGSAFYRYFFGG